MSSESETEHSSAKENCGLILGLLAGPILWLVSFQANYALVLHACSTDETAVLHVISLAMFLVVLAVGAVSVRHFKNSTKPEINRPPELIERNRFLSLLGILSSSLFALLIIAQALGTFFISPCWD